MSSNPMDNGYVTVADRLAAFTEEHKAGLIQTELLNFSGDFVVVGAKVWRDRATADDGKLADGTGMASMPIPGPTSFTKNSEVENAETSAIGRALAAIGYLAKDEKGNARISSSEEIASKSGGDDGKRRFKTGKNAGEEKASGKQLGKIRQLAEELEMDDDELREFTKKETGRTNSGQITKEDASKMIDVLKVRLATDGAEVE